ncbi:MAG TPA: hypothetical protein VIW64_16255 [Pyrinomonadaceae bacterium]
MSIENRQSKVIAGQNYWRLPKHLPATRVLARLVVRKYGFDNVYNAIETAALESQDCGLTIDEILFLWLRK